MKPYTSQKYGSKAVPYTLGISSSNNGFDQKRGVINLKPGHHISVKVQPKLVQTSEQFDELDVDLRKCKLSHETDGFHFLNGYSRKGCELECAIQRAIIFCKCLPWFLPNNDTNYPMCDMFGGYCFDKIMSDEAQYKKCRCFEDCQETVLTTWQSYQPLDLKDVCRKGSFLDKSLEYTFSQHFAFQNYITLVEQGSLPDLITSFSNGSLCMDFVSNFISFVTIESPTSSVIRSKRESYTVSFNDQMGTIGGTLGLFTGMSVLSFVEIIFLLLILFTGTVQEFRERYKKKYTPDEDLKIQPQLQSKECNCYITNDKASDNQYTSKEDLLQVHVIFLILTKFII
jgi:uncharacterized membrane protein